MWAHCARCHGGSWWWSTAGRPRSHAATARAAGRFSGIVQRFSTTTRSAPAERGVERARGRRRRRADGETGEEVVDRPVAGDRADRPPQPARARAPRSRRPPRRRRDARAGTTRRRPRARRHATDRRASSPRWCGRCWRPRGATIPAGGFCVPNPTTYPWQWLWDSCFHAVVWAHLGDERAVVELRTRAVRAGRRRLRAPPPLRRRAVPARGAVGPASVVDDHPAADVRACGRGARPSRGSPPADEVVERGRSAGWSSCSARRRRTRAAWWSSATRGSRAATTARGGTTPCPAGARPRRGSTARASWSRRSSGRRAARRSTTRRSRSARWGSARWWRGTRSSWRPSPATTTSRPARRRARRCASTRAGTPSA